MSRSGMTVEFPDGTTLYGLYNGTSESIWPALFDTQMEAWDEKARVYHSSEFAEVFYQEPQGEVVDAIITIDGFPSIRGRATKNAVTWPISEEQVSEAMYGKDSW